MKNWNPNCKDNRCFGCRRYVESQSGVAVRRQRGHKTFCSQGCANLYKNFSKNEMDFFRGKGFYIHSKGFQSFPTLTSKGYLFNVTDESSYAA